jgi:hypothetical protein
MPTFDDLLSKNVNQAIVLENRSREKHPRSPVRQVDMNVPQRDGTRPRNESLHEHPPASTNAPRPMDYLMGPNVAYLVNYPSGSNVAYLMSYPSGLNTTYIVTYPSGTSFAYSIHPP